MRCLRLATAVIVGLLAVAPLTAPAAAAPPYSLEERAAAIASPSLVFLDVRVEGYLRVRKTGALVNDTPVSVHRYCSGFGVSSVGHVVTTTHCLQPSPAVLRSLAANAVATALVEAKKLATAQKADWVKQITSTSDFTGTTVDTQPVTSVTGQLFLGSTEPDGAAAITGQVVESQPIDSGDTTLIKLETTAMPVAKVSQVPLDPGMSVVQVGFATSDPNARPVTYTAKFRAGKVVGRNGTASPVQSQLDGHLGGASHGGMVIDNNGTVIGMITGDLTGEDRSNRLAADPSQVLSLLSTAGVKNDLAAADQAYRTGLDAYFGGHYGDAISSFDTVIAAQPNHLPALNYRRQASERQAIEGDSASGTPIWPFVVAGVALLLVIVLVAIVLILGRRLRSGDRALVRYGPYQPAALPAAPVPISGVPVSSMPISGPPMLPAPAAAPTPTPAPAPAPAPAAQDSWRAPVAPGGADYSIFATPPRAMPPTSQPATASQQPEQTTWPDEDTTAAWPAVTVWRSPHSEEPVPPPAPAPNVQFPPPDGRTAQT